MITALLMLVSVLYWSARSESLRPSTHRLPTRSSSSPDPTTPLSLSVGSSHPARPSSSTNGAEENDTVQQGRRVREQLHQIDASIRAQLPKGLLREDCGEGPAGRHPSWDSSVEEVRSRDDSLQRNKERYERCFQGAQFMYFGNDWGRHFNQVTSLLAALVLSRSLNRTLVLPPFVVGKQKLELSQLYDARPLMDIRTSPFCVLTEREWFSLETERLRLAGETVPSKMATPATCVVMRGIKPFPQSPESFTFDCNAYSTEPTFIKFKKNLTLFFDTVGRGTHASRSRFLTVPLVIYYAQAMPLEATLCPWRLLQPHPFVRTAVELVYRAVSSASTSNNNNEEKGTVSIPRRRVVGIHHRSLEGSCTSRMKKFSESAAQRTAFVQQCLMTSSYVRGFAYDNNISHNGDARDATIFLVADDGQDESRVGRLLTELGHGAQQLKRITGDSAPKHSPFQEFQHSVVLHRRRLDEGAGGNREQLEPPFEVGQSGYAVVPSLFTLQVDYWALVMADVFVGNQISTVSMNVCRARLARSRLCENFVF